MGWVSDVSHAAFGAPTTNPLAGQLRPSAHELAYALGIPAGTPGEEQFMELIAAWPEWLVWFAAGAIGAFALASLARMLLAALDLDAG